MIRPAVDACFSLRGNVATSGRGGKAGGGARRGNKTMAKFIGIKKSVHIGADHPTASADGAVPYGTGNSFPKNIGKRLSLRFVSRFSEMNLIAMKDGLDARRGAKDIASRSAMYPSNRLLWMKHGAHRKESQSHPITGCSLILDTLGIFNGNTEHLKAAADADDRHADFREPAKLTGKTTMLQPL